VTDALHSGSADLGDRSSGGRTDLWKGTEVGEYADSCFNFGAYCEWRGPEGGHQRSHL